MIRLLISYLFTVVFISLSAQESAHQVLNKSIKYHDPQGKLQQEHFTLELIGRRPGGPDQKSTVYLNIRKDAVRISSVRDGSDILMTKEEGAYSFTIDGRVELTDVEMSKYRLNPHRLELMKNYYRYLWLAPLVLYDPGTIVHERVRQKDFFGTTALEIKVTYAPEVGKDIWYFYFDPSSYAMIGYRFYHDEAANDGEYILLSGEFIYESVKIPQHRKWYTHKDHAFLGEDILTAMQVH